MDGWKNGKMDRQIDGLMVGWIKNKERQAFRQTD